MAELLRVIAYERPGVRQFARRQAPILCQFDDGLKPEFRATILAHDMDMLPALFARVEEEAETPAP